MYGDSPQCHHVRIVFSLTKYSLLGWISHQPAQLVDSSLSHHTSANDVCHRYLFEPSRQEEMALSANLGLTNAMVQQKGFVLVRNPRKIRESIFLGDKHATTSTRGGCKYVSYFSAVNSCTHADIDRSVLLKEYKGCVFHAVNLTALIGIFIYTRCVYLCPYFTIYLLQYNKM